jgi:CSLREA domain-containing protein
MFAFRCALIVALVLFPGSLFATTFPVTKTADTDDGICDPDCSLREAIGAANANPGADDVPIPAGIYRLSLGQLVVSDDVEIAGAGEASTIIDGNRSSRVFEIQTGSVAAISSVTIQSGSEESQFIGGGIANYGNLTLTNTTVRENQATDFLFRGIGGGIFNDSGALNLINSTVAGNQVANAGGGIFNRSGTITLTDSTVSANRGGTSGGGIQNSGGFLTLTNSAVIDNLSLNDVLEGNGGGISNSGDLTLTNSTVSGNTAGYFVDPYRFTGRGGGIANTGTTILTNSTVSGNRVRANGGGIDHSIFGAVTLSNTIVADNFVNNCSTGVDSFGYNLTDDTSCNLAAPGDLVVADAMLGPLDDNGGPTKTHALLPGSPAIDAGSADCPPPATDQRSVTRPQGAACDIGSFESAAETSLVEIDIRPGNESNSINPYGRGRISVAILGSAVFDVIDIDVATLRFGPEAAAPDDDLSVTAVFENQLRDVDGDGFADLVSHYRAQSTGIAFGDAEACVTGATLHGALFEGCDAIKTVPLPRGQRR